MYYEFHTWHCSAAICWHCIISGIQFCTEWLHSVLFWNEWYLVIYADARGTPIQVGLMSFDEKNLSILMTQSEDDKVRHHVCAIREASIQVYMSVWFLKRTHYIMRAAQPMCWQSPHPYKACLSPLSVSSRTVIVHLWGRITSVANGKQEIFHVFLTTCWITSYATNRDVQNQHKRHVKLHAINHRFIENLGGNKWVGLCLRYTRRWFLLCFVYF